MAVREGIKLRPPPSSTAHALQCLLSALVVFQLFISSLLCIHLIFTILTTIFSAARRLQLLGQARCLLANSKGFVKKMKRNACCTFEDAKNMLDGTATAEEEGKKDEKRERDKKGEEGGRQPGRAGGERKALRCEGLELCDMHVACTQIYLFTLPSIPWVRSTPARDFPPR